MPNVRRIGFALALALVGCSSPDAATERLGKERQPIIKGTASSSEQDDVILVAWNIQGQDQQACSGELVAPNLVLTAHHCVGEVDDNTLAVTRNLPGNLRIYTGADAPTRVGSEKAAAVGTKIF